MTDFLIDYAKKNVEKLVDGALKELRYIFCFTCIAKEFEEEKGWLQAKRTAVGQRVQVAKRRGENVQADALFWEGEVDKIIQEDSKTKQKCFFGLCPDCIWRYRRGKELTNKKEKIKIFLDIEKELEIGLPAPLPDVERYSSQNYISFKSRVLKYNELLDALEDEKNYIIGLQGMGGTGKTTLAKEVGKKLKESKQFTYVIDTTVSFSPNIKKIQDDIAGPLGLKFNDCSESDRPKKLWKRLTNGEKILIILDDVWKDINFEEIGIPYSDNHKGCRVLVTTRNVSVCNKLGCSKTIKLELLSQDDAWEMFKRHAGLTEMSSESLLDKGFKISNECQGLPIAIAVIASSLMGNQRQEDWDEALKSLQKHAPINKTGDDDDSDLTKIYDCLKFSYDNMKDGKSKRLFLLCSVFPEDEEIPTERLIRLGIGAGIFGEYYGNYEDARSQVVRSKNKLLDSCLLLEIDGDRVKMHDLVRDAAQWIANEEIQTIKLYDKNQKEMVERETNIKYLLCEGKLKNVISCKLDSTKLQMLIVILQMDDGNRHNEKTEIPNSFFENISGLRVFHLIVNFYQANLSLPQSIQSLNNIRSLLFSHVDLGDISILGNLQSLETLDLDWCQINEFPEGMGKLPNLRLLKLKSCLIRRNNPFKVIEGCSSLEELYFIRSFNDCCREISFPLLQRFILDDGMMFKNESVSKCVSLLQENDKYLLPKKQLKDCIQAAEVLALRGIWWEWVNIIPEIVTMDHGMNDLVELKLRCIPQLKCLIDTKHDNSQVKTVFSKLVVLELVKMKSLGELCNGPLSFDSLKSLEKLIIMGCNQLQSLFTCSLNLFNLKTLTLIDCPMLISLLQLTTSRSLVSLKKLVIVGCKHLEYIIIDERKENKSRGEIVVDDSKRSHESMFPKLKYISIEECHGLEFIFSFISIQDLPALESLSISCCEKLQYIFSQYVQIDSLKKVDLRNLPNLINIFPKCHPTTSFGEASKPGKQLEPMKGSVFLWTDVCCLGKKYRHKSMTTASTTIPSVSEDQQQDLPSKTTLLVGPKNSFSLNYLSWIKIEQCEKLEFVFSTSILRCLPQLIYLKIEECKELRHIIEDDLENEKSITFRSVNTYFPKLEILIVGNCNKLKCVFQTSACKELPKLKFFIIREAYELQEIFKTQSDDQKLEIPNLKVVSFINLPNLCYAQGKHFQAVKYRLVQNCHKLSLTSALISDCIDEIDDINDISGYLKGLDDELCEELVILLKPLINEYESHDTCNGKPSSEVTHEFEAEAASESESILTSSQPQVLMNEQSMDQQHSLGETDTTIKPQLDGYTTPEKTSAANSSAISETKKEPPIQLVAPKQKGVEISAEEGITTTNVKTLTSSTHSKSDSSSLDPLITSECETSSKKDGDCQIATTSLSIATTDIDDKVSPNANSSMKVSSNIEEQFPKDDKIIVSNSRPSPIITSPIAYQFPSKGDPSQKVEELSSSLPVTRDYENLSLLTDFLVKHPSVLLKDTSLSNRYKGYAYNCLAELLKFLQTHSVLDVLGSNHSEFVELLQDVRKCGFDKEWLDGIERRVLFRDTQVSPESSQKLLDSKQQEVSKEVEVLRLKIAILSQCAEDLKHQLIDLKHQLKSSEAALESIIQQKRVLSAPVGY